MRKITLITLFFMSSLSHAGNLFTVTGTTAQLTVGVVPNHTYPAAGIKITSNNYALSGVGTDCTMSGSGYCNFLISKNTPRQFAISGSGSSVNIQLCLNGVGPLSCQKYTVPLTPAGDTVTDYVYVVNSLGNTVSLCQGSADGMLSNCTDSGATSLFVPRGIVKHPNLNVVYIANSSSDSITRYSINTTTKLLQSCVEQTGLNLSGPSGLAMREDMSSYYLYVANFNAGSVSYCTIDGTGAISACSDAVVLASSLGIAFNPSGSIAYISSNAQHRIYACGINPGAETLTCSTFASAGSNNPELVTYVSTVVNGNLLYVPTNGNDGVQQCVINSLDGSISSCANAKIKSKHHQP